MHTSPSGAFLLSHKYQKSYFKEKKKPYISRPYATGTWLPLWGWTWLQVGSAAFQKTREEPDSADRWSKQCPAPWQREQIPIYLLSYMFSQACCCVPVLPGSMSILLWGCNSMPPSMLWKLFCPRCYFRLFELRPDRPEYYWEEISLAQGRKENICPVFLLHRLAV